MAFDVFNIKLFLSIQYNMLRFFFNISTCIVYVASHYIVGPRHIHSVLNRDPIIETVSDPIGVISITSLNDG